MARGPEQLGLFTPRPPVPPRTPANWTPTSRAAAASVRAHAENQQDRVLAYIEACGSRGASNAEIHEALGIRESSVCARTNRLWSLGAIRPSEETRPTSSGRPAKVWVRKE